MVFTSMNMACGRKTACPRAGISTRRWRRTAALKARSAMSAIWATSRRTHNGNATVDLDDSQSELSRRSLDPRPGRGCAREGRRPEDAADRQRGRAAGSGRGGQSRSLEKLSSRDCGEWSSRDSAGCGCRRFDALVAVHDAPRARSMSERTSATVSKPGNRTIRFSELSHLFTFFSAAMTVV